MQQVNSPTAVRRRIDVQNLDGILAEVNRLREAGYEKAGQWDLSQACQHLAAAMNGSIDGIGDKAPLLVRVVGRFFIKAAVLRARRIRAGVEAPEGAVFKPMGNDRVAVEKLTAAVERFRKHQGPCVEHPIFGKLTRDEWEQFHIIHASHHLGFLVPRK